MCIVCGGPALVYLLPCHNNGFLNCNILIDVNSINLDNDIACNNIFNDREQINNMIYTLDISHILAIPSLYLPWLL